MLGRDFLCVFSCILHWTLCGICVCVHRKSGEDIRTFWYLLISCVKDINNTHIVVGFRALRFCLGLYFTEICNLDVQLSKNQSWFINKLYVMRTEAHGVKNPNLQEFCHFGTLIGPVYQDAESLALTSLWPCLLTGSALSLIRVSDRTAADLTPCGIMYHGPDKKARTTHLFPLMKWISHSCLWGEVFSQWLYPDCLYGVGHQ